MEEKIKKTKFYTPLLLSFVFFFNAYIGIAQTGLPTNPTYGNISSTAPTSFYDGLLGLSDTELRNKIQGIVVNTETKGQNYGDVWTMLESADENPNDNSQVWLVYSEIGIAKTEHVSGTTGWNREHTFPQSRGGFSDGTSFSADGKDVYFSTTADDIAHAHGDAHHIRASLATENSNRGALDFDNVTGPRTKDSYFYEPPLSAKGDVARALFYMAVRYNDLSVAPGDQNGQVIGNLTTLLEWNKLDPPDDYELRRNNVIYEWQNNRNPFIDNPDLADYLWGDKTGQSWQGNSGSSIILSASLSNFGIVRYGNISTTQSYTIEANELSMDLEILAPENFEISLTDLPENFTSRIMLSQTDGQISTTTIYIRFKPTQNTNAEISGYITHTSGKTSSKLTVKGTEGDPLKQPEVLYSQDFETNCADDWVKYSVSSNEDWTCDSFGLNYSQGIKMNNYQADADSEDWFISPSFDVSGYTNPTLQYWLESTYDGSTLELLYSTDYAGSGDPGLANWTQLNDITLTENWTQLSTELSVIGQSSFYLAYKYTSILPNASRINMDDIEILVTPIVAEISTSVSSLNFPYTTPGSSSASLNYTVSGSNLKGDVLIETSSPFELSLDDITWSSSVTIAQADASATVYVRFSPISDYIKGYTAIITHSTTNGTNYVCDLLSADNPGTVTDASTLNKSQTLDIVTWNLEWFGAPEKSNNASSWNEQLTNVSTSIIDLDADIYALQEVIVDDLNGNYLDSLLNKLNTLAGAGTYTGNVGPRYSLDDRAPSTDWPAQRVCYIYRTSNFSNVQSESMFSALYPNTNTTSIPGYTGTASQFWASGRLPFLFQADVTIDGITAPVDFINIHAKCCTDSKDRKVADALFLKDELDTNFDTENVIVLGDYNDYYEGSMSGGDSPYISWFANASEDYLRAIGANIDHISISNELYYEYQSLSNNTSIGSTTVSDHNPVLLRLKLNNNTLDGQVIKLDDISNKSYGTDPFLINAQSSVGLPVEYEIVSGPATLSGSVLSITDVGTVVVKAFNNGSINTLSTFDQKEFSVVKASQTITFDLPTEVNLSEGSLLMSASSSIGLDVSFRIISGTGTIAGNELNFTEAGSITVEAYQDGNDQYYSASEQKSITVVDNTTSIPELSKLKFAIYPNPTSGIINIEYDSDNMDVVMKIYNTTGSLIESKKLSNNSSSLDLSHLGTGVYIIKVESKKALGSKTIMIK